MNSRCYFYQIGNHNKELIDFNNIQCMLILVLKFKLQQNEMCIHMTYRTFFFNVITVQNDKHTEIKPLYRVLISTKTILRYLIYNIYK